MERYKVKNRVEHWIFFKILKLPVIFFGTYFGLLLLIVVMSIGKRGGDPVFWAEYADQVFQAIWWFSGFALIYYLYTKLRHNEIDEIVFDDNLQVLKIVFRNYLFHFKFNRGIHYADLNFSNDIRNDFINGKYEHVEFFSKTKRIAVISGSSVDWHNMPNSLKKIIFKMTEIKVLQKLNSPH